MEVNKIICGDCIEEMKKLPDESVDLIWFSPPYWDLHKYSKSKKEKGYGQTFDEYILSLKKVSEQGKRILKKDGNFIINIMDIVRKNKPMLLSTYCIKNFDLIFIERIVWFIKNKMPVASNRRFVNKFEWVLHFSKSENYYFNKDSIRLPHSIYAKKDKRKWNKKGKCPGNVWFIEAYRVSGKNKYHVAGFPIKLCEMVIKCWSKPNDLVLDPFVGSGTTAVACKQLGRKFIGIDISPEYCEMARKRLQQEVLI